MSISSFRLLAALLATWIVAGSAHGEDVVLSPRQVLMMHETTVATSGVQVVRGIVTFVSGIEHKRFEIAPQDQPWTRGVVVRLRSAEEMPLLGDIVLISGELVWNEDAPAISADDVDVVMHGTLNKPKGAKQSDYRRGILTGRRMSLSGTVREVRHRQDALQPVTDLILRIDNYSTLVCVPGKLEAKDYLGEPIRIVGLVRTISSDSGSFLDAWMEVGDPSDIQMLRGERLSRLLIICSAVVGCALLLTAAVFLFLWVRVRRERREMEVVAAERRRMAADLHDTIEQYLAGANLIAAGVKTIENVPPEVREAMNALAAMLANAKAEVRSAVLSLRSAGDCSRTLAQLIEAISAALEKTGIRARRCLRGLPESLPEGVSHDIELIVREATTNAVKHGKAKNIVFTSDPHGNGGFVLRVLNDGEPFDASRALGPETGHYGLSGMRERALRNRLAISWGTDRGWMFMELISEGI